jgi:hypothetical protein
LRESNLTATECVNAPIGDKPPVIVVDYKLAEGTYTSGVRRATPPEPHDCPTCGSAASDPDPAHLVDGIYLDCPRCPSRPLHENGNSAAQQLAADVRDILAEEAARGQGKSSSSGGAKKRDNRRARIQARFEQEVALFNNGHSGDRVQITRMETASERVELQLTIDCKERLQEVSHERRDDVRRPFPQVQLIRDALKRYVHALEAPRETERGEAKARMELRLYPNELLLLDRACEFWTLSRGEIIEACLLEHLGGF